MFLLLAWFVVGKVGTVGSYYYIANKLLYVHTVVELYQYHTQSKSIEEKKWIQQSITPQHQHNITPPRPWIYTVLTLHVFLSELVSVLSSSGGADGGSVVAVVVVVVVVAVVV